MQNRYQRWLAAGLGLALVMPAVAVAAEGDIVARFKIKGPLAEQPDAMGLAALLGDEAPPNMFDLLEKLKKARSDDNVKAVIFDIDSASLGVAQIQELRAQFEALEAADKEVWVLTEGLDNGGLMLGSAASQLILVPSGEVVIHGLYGEALYFKNLLDKIGFKADILHCGDYKSAGEPFYRTGPSDADKEQTNRLLDSMFETWITETAKSREISPDQMRAHVDKAIFSSKEALEAKLVDKLMYREDFVKAIKNRYGDDVKVNSNYGGPKAPEIDFDNPFAVFKLLGDVMKTPDASTEPAIAVVYVESMITSGKTEHGLFGGVSNAGSDTVRKAIAQAAEDDNVKALVLRVDSPGGSALASDIICEAAERFRKTDRPFIVSMGNVAASGGYYVSALSDTIFAEPGTITGSIGVVGGKIVTKEFWDWVGVTGHEYKRGKRADIMNTNRPWDEEERAVMMDMMNRIYGDFKDRVLAGRKDKLKKEIDKLAGGRVYTGAQALDLGLVDKLGGLNDAVKYAAAEAEVSDYELRVFPRPKTFMDVLGEIFGGKEKDEEFVDNTMRLGQTFLRQPAVASMLEGVKAVDPQKARKIVQFLIQMELFSHERVLMVGSHANLLIR
ncbi:MAG TPA: signal peptide peptidase SppA [Phycisphaerae bacterium]|nr:signal peptide peptidase SppA [Phycisphaerae bacterium]